MAFLTPLSPATAPLLEALLPAAVGAGAGSGGGGGSAAALPSLRRAPPPPPGGGHVLFEHFWLERGPLALPGEPGGPPAEGEGAGGGRSFVLTPSVRRHLATLARAALLRRHPILLQARAPGAGGLWPRGRRRTPSSLRPACPRPRRRRRRRAARRETIIPRTEPGPGRGPLRSAGGTCPAPLMFTRSTHRIRADADGGRARRRRLARNHCHAIPRSRLCAPPPAGPNVKRQNVARGVPCAQHGAHVRCARCRRRRRSSCSHISRFFDRTHPPAVERPWPQ